MCGVVLITRPTALFGAVDDSTFTAKENAIGVALALFSAFR